MPCFMLGKRGICILVSWGTNFGEAGLQKRKAETLPEKTDGTTRLKTTTSLKTITRLKTTTRLEGHKARNEVSR